MPLTDSRTLLAATALLAAFAIVPVGPGPAADESENSGEGSAEKSAEPELDSRGRLPASEYFTMKPFVVPVIKDGEHHKQFVLVVAIELNDSDDRFELRRLSPRMRNEIYELLFKVVSFRTIEPRIPPKEVLKIRLTRVVRRVVGEELVKSIYVQAANIKDVH